MLGFPIRTPPDHSLVANSPGLIAGSNVLHRLLMPRHPPCALHSLSQQRQNNTRCTHPTKEARNKTKEHPTHPQSKDEPVSFPTPPTPRKRGKQAAPKTQLHTRNTPEPAKPANRAHHEDARVHYADLKQQPHQHPQPPTGGLEQREEQKPNHTDRSARLIPQDPTVCLTLPPPPPTRCTGPR